MSRAQMFCALTTVPVSVSTLRGFDALHDAVGVQQSPNFDAFDDLDAHSSRRSRKRAGDEIRIGKPRVGFVADQRRIVEPRDRQQTRGLPRIELLHRDALSALTVETRAQGRESRSVRRRDQIAALHETRRRFGIADVIGEIHEHAPRRTREFDVLRHRVVRAQNPRRLRCGAGADLAAVEHEHPFGAEVREVIRDRAADHAGTDDDRVEVVHSTNPFRPRPPRVHATTSVRVSKRAAATAHRTCIAACSNPSTWVCSSHARRKSRDERRRAGLRTAPR